MLDGNLDDINGNYRVIKDGVDDIVVVRNMKYKKIVTKNINTLGVGDEYGIETCNNRPNYVVKPLDTLTSIANMFNITEQELIKINNLKTARVFVGQLLKL